MEELIIAALPYLIGPGAATIVLFIILVLAAWGAYRLLDKHVLPQIKDWMEKQDEKFETIMKSHEDDRKVFKESVEALTGKIDNTDVRVEKLRNDIEDLRYDVVRRLRFEEAQIHEREKHEQI